MKTGSHSQKTDDRDDETGIQCAGLTHVGKKRASNQDQFLIADLHKNLKIQSSSVSFESPELSGEVMGKLLLVADGMGGASAGDVASAMAIKSTARFLLSSMHWLFHPRQPEIEQFVNDLKTAAQFSHENVRKDAYADPNHRGMGTTLTLAYVLWPMLYVLHVGDSRCYVLHRDRLQRLTKDQTVAQYLLDHGQLEGEDFEDSPYQHVLMSAIGIEGQFDATVYRKRLATGDRILLCSDGVNAHLDDATIGEILKMDLDPDAICQQIIDQTNRGGGHDNITAIVANCRGSEREDLSESSWRDQMKLQNTKNSIIVPWDFSDLSRDALARAIEMVDDPSLIKIVHVTQSPSVYEYGVAWEMITDESIRDSIIESFQKGIEEDDRFTDLKLTVLFGDPGKRICEYAKEVHAELIIMPSHGRSGFTRLMLGSVAERVVRFAPCPVLILRDDGEDDKTDSPTSSDTNAMA